MRKGQVLVLNYDFSPITVCSIHRAFLLVYLDKAEMMAQFAHLQLRTVSLSFAAPAVVRLNSYINKPYKGVILSRQNIFKRDGHECQYCGSRRDLTLDHIVPRSRNGGSTWTNLVTACKRCNSRKGNCTPEMVGLKLKSTPVKPSYIHFLRNQSGLMTEEWKPFLNYKRAS